MLRSLSEGVSVRSASMNSGMRRGSLAWLGAAVLACGAAGAATRDLDAVGAPIAPALADSQIAGTLAQISVERIERDIATLAAFHTRQTLSSMESALPPTQGARAAADWIESELKSYAAACGGCLEVRRDTFTEMPQDRIPHPTVISNVYAILRGSDPLQAQHMYLVSAHYDSRNSDTLDARGEAPGANDDASGVAVSLESARVLSKLKPRSTLVFVAVAGEEQGLNGSRHLAKLAASEHWQLEAVLNNDIVGGNTTPADRWQDKSAVRVFSEGIPAVATPEQLRVIESAGYEGDSPSRELARALVEVAQTYGSSRRGAASVLGDFHPVLELRPDRFLRGGDHTSFNREGFAAVRLTEWREDYNHQHQDVRTENGIEYGDLLKFVDFHYVQHVAQLNAAALATFAYAPPQPRDVRILTRALDAGTTLEWESSSDVQYEVLWRETGSSLWQRGVSARLLASPQPAAASGAAATGAPADAPVRTSVFLPISKDNVIFGVRAVDAAGHRSVAVVPWPAR
jgi:hypothetical protein